MVTPLPSTSIPGTFELGFTRATSKVCVVADRGFDESRFFNAGAT
jgi:hypothetical protein